MKEQSRRFLFVDGPPGSGKSALLLEAAIQAAKETLRVLIVCPTGNLVHSSKAQLPDVDGIENISIDTIHGVLNYKRPGQDGKVRWAPPSALRKMDLILCDEGSQYDDQEWKRLYQCIREQPHKPYTCVVADFQQLQPVVCGGSCQSFCELMETIHLDTVYRTKDESHLLFLNRIRYEQPDRDLLLNYFGDRHWQRSASLESCVAYGMRLAEQTGKPFTWLTSTNAGAALICEAALRVQKVPEEELVKGYMCDPTSKSTLRIVARPGIMLRLTRNQDKQRGFVNGALGVVKERLAGNGVFVVRLYSLLR